MFFFFEIIILSNNYFVSRWYEILFTGITNTACVCLCVIGTNNDAYIDHKEN